MERCDVFSRWVSSISEFVDGAELCAEILCFIVENRIVVDKYSYGFGFICSIELLSVLAALATLF